MKVTFGYRYWLICCLLGLGFAGCYRPAAGRYDLDELDKLKKMGPMYRDLISRSGKEKDSLSRYQRHWQAVLSAQRDTNERKKIQKELNKVQFGMNYQDSMRKLYVYLLAKRPAELREVYARMGSDH